MTKYTFCPVCGHKLAKSSPGSYSEVTCSNCGQYVNFRVEDHQMIINDQEPDKIQKKYQETRKLINQSTI